MADYGGQRQIRQADFVPTPARDPLSDEQHQYTDPVPGMQAKYANAAEYNGEAARGRVRGSDG